MSETMNDAVVVKAPLHCQGGGFIITMETNLWVYEGISRKVELWRKTHSVCGWHHPTGWGLSLNRTEKTR